MTAFHVSPAKSDPRLIATDDQHFARLGDALARSIAELEERLARTLGERGESGGEAVERDMEMRRITARLRTLRRFGLDLTLGRMVGDEVGYIGRLGLSDHDGQRLLIDWRSPMAAPFFGATRARPMGLASRRRYRWANGAITDYWDEVFTAEVAADSAALDDESAFIASLGSTRTPQMRDVLATIQADQDAIIRAPSRGALVVDGGPGTGKTVVALHRAAFLLYSEPRLSERGILFVGPHPAYLSYVGDVLPNLGEESVQLATLRDLVAEGAQARAHDPAAALKSSARMTEMVDNAVRLYERPPTRDLGALDADDWAEAFDAAEPGSSHNAARAQVWDALRELAPEELDELAPTFDRSWPVLDAAAVVSALWTKPEYLRRSAPWLTPREVSALQRADGEAWTVADLPILDCARARVGLAVDDTRRNAEIARQREQIARVVDDLIASASFDEVWMLRHDDMQEALIDGAALPTVEPDLLAGPFAHIVIDEAQELTDAEWQMLLRRCPSRSVTIVGDRAQARAGFRESWEQRLTRVGFDQVRVASLSVNYRTPAEIMAAAEPVIRAELPDANVPTSIRRSGIPVRFGRIDELDTLTTDGTMVVIDEHPEATKGLEFDLVVLIDPERWSAVDRYVAMTRATRELVILTR